ncbi:FeoA family protein [Allochromatium vinosum]|uniref:FeoA family protein n=1 Tax=Allochromatium vinosum (strain ATCC 17899 / DSM 180 / NBRC 103801 / NCIMB 10441 / D) TaxID=572477 RepID=D3RTF1_ALLVD|nr:FeoA family protein [Allochromatium vinosum]ADC62460.1 FeoA family protein [Allochromatium vinosum DSM 180]MBK1653135.1 ferrous iron transport protein A [Allochromatium vinosum]
MTRALSSHPGDIGDPVFCPAVHIDRCESQPAAKTFPLAMAGEGERVRIQTLQGGKGLAKRLTELGLNPGTEVCIVTRQGGGLVVARGETRLALGCGMAVKILVEAIDG